MTYRGSGRFVRRYGEDGFAVAEWIAAVGLLLLPTAMLVLSFPGWVERQGMARVAAREAARAVAIADSTQSGSQVATELVREIARNHGVDPGTVSVTYSGTTARGAMVTATVTVQLPALSFPGAGRLGSVQWSTRHSEPVDQYRGFAP